MLEAQALSMETIAAVFENSEDCVKLIDPSGRLLWMNANGMCAMEIDDFSDVEGGEWGCFWPDEEVDRVRATYMSDRPRPSRFRAFCPTAKGTSKWWDVTVTPVRDVTGRHAGFIAASRDVTELELADRNREVLVAELRHRQRNTLMLAASLMRLHGRSHPEARDFVADMTSRLDALGRAQGVIAQSHEEERDLADLLPTLVAPLAGPDCKLDIFVDPDLRIPPAMVDVVGVIFGELSVNAGKHGAFAKGGRVGVTASRNAEGRIEIAWSERSQAEVRRTSRRGGQGLDLMGRISGMNGAAFSVEWRPAGLHARLMLPAGI